MQIVGEMLESVAQTKRKRQASAESASLFARQWHRHSFQSAMHITYFSTGLVLEDTRTNEQPAGGRPTSLLRRARVCVYLETTE